MVVALIPASNPAPPPGPAGEKFTVEELRDVVDKVLANPKYRSAAQRISRSLRAAGGTERAVQLIELFLRDNTTSTG